MQPMNKYSNGKIYKIVSPNHPKVYYGSTIQTLEDRFHDHATLFYNGCTSREIIKAGDADIFEIEPFPCTCKEELEDREAEFIENNYDDCVNKIIPGAVRRAGGKLAYARLQYDKPEYKAKRKTAREKPETKAYMKAYQKEWQKKPEYKAYQKAYGQTPEAKARRHVIHQTPEHKAKQQAYDHKRKAYRAEQIPCNVCGKCVSRGNMGHHQKTKTCQKHLKTELDKVMEDIIRSIENY